METVFGWFPSSGLGTRCLKLLLHETWQAGACKGRVPKLEFGNRRKPRSRRFLFVAGLSDGGNADLGLRGLFAMVSFDEGQPVAVEHIADIDEENPIHQAFKQEFPVQKLLDAAPVGPFVNAPDFVARLGEPDGTGKTRPSPPRSRTPTASAAAA